MEDILEKFGIGEFFAYISPGAILLSSIVLWIELDFDSKFWEHEVLVVTLFFVFSYILGLVLASFNQQMHARYTRLSTVEAGGRLGQIWAQLLRLVYRFPSARLNESLVDANLRIADDLVQITGLHGLSSLTNPWEYLDIYRALVEDKAGKDHQTVLLESENLHRKFLFSMGVALALFFLVLQALLRVILFYIPQVSGLIISLGLRLFQFPKTITDIPENIEQWYVSLPTIDLLVLFVIIILGLLASLQLREIAIRMWELERYLTTSLTHSVGSDSKPENLLQKIFKELWSDDESDA